MGMERNRRNRRIGVDDGSQFVVVLLMQMDSFEERTWQLHEPKFDFRHAFLGQSVT